MSKFLGGFLLVICSYSFCHVGNCDEDAVFENKNQQRQYERVLKRIQSMNPAGGEESNADDWFVVGGAIGNEVNFDAYQGEKYVARRVAEFIKETRNRGQWKIYSRAPDSEIAQEQLEAVKFSYENWRQAEYNRMAANEIYRQNQIRTASYNPYPPSYNPYPTGHSYTTGTVFRSLGSYGPTSTSRNFGVSGFTGGMAGG